MKICTKCQREFVGSKARCNACLNSYNKENRLANLDKRRAKARERYWKNPVKARTERVKAYNPLVKAPYDVIYRAQNKEKIANYKKRWESLHKDEPLFKIKRNLRRRIHHLLKDGYKSKHTVELLGCSFEEFKLYIESKFVEGMSWENYGQWHLDHIKPCCKFDLTKIEEQLECFNYKNQQPLWRTENLKKGRKYATNR